MIWHSNIAMFLPIVAYLARISWVILETTWTDEKSWNTLALRSIGSWNFSYWSRTISEMLQFDWRFLNGVQNQTKLWTQPTLLASWPYFPDTWRPRSTSRPLLRSSPACPALEGPSRSVSSFQAPARPSQKCPFSVQPVNQEHNWREAIS